MRYNTKDVAKACAQAAHEALRVHCALMGAHVPPHWMAPSMETMREGAIAWTASILLHGGVIAAHDSMESDHKGMIETWEKSPAEYQREMLMTEKVIFAVAESLGLTRELITASLEKERS